MTPNEGSETLRCNSADPPVKPCTASIQKLFNQLCCHHLEQSTNHKRALVIRRKYTEEQVSKLKKTLYLNLYLGLHSPYIPTTEPAVIDNRPYSDNVYTKLAESVFNIRMIYGQVQGADKLETCGNRLQKHGDDAAEKVLKLLLSLSNYYSNPSKDMFLSSNRLADEADRFFQFDQKAFDLENTLRNTRLNEMFEISQDSVFTAPIGSHIIGGVPAWMKMKNDSSHVLDWACDSRLFGGLTNSSVTSLDVTLSLPDLPKDPRNTDFNRRRTSVGLQVDERVDSRTNSSSLDEGFHELSTFSTSCPSVNYGRTDIKTITIWDDLSIWDEALALEKSEALSWEIEGNYNPRLDCLYFCQLGKRGFDCMYNARLSEVTHITGEPLQVIYVDEKQLFRDTLFALVGVQSKTYKFCERTCSMSPQENIQSPGLGIESLYEFMCRFARVGTHYRQLCKFCEHHSDKPASGIGGGLILNAFIGAIKEILHSYRSAYFVILNFVELTLMELWQLFEMFAKQLKFLADTCLCSEAFNNITQHDGFSPKPKFPKGANLLSYIYSLAVKNSSTEQYPLLLYIFKCISVPYIRLLADWLFDGALNDPYDEFFVNSDDQYLRSRDRHFWTQGFQLKHKRGSIPLFLDELSDSIFACGKAINLLKVADRQHYLFGGSVQPPPIDITYSSARFDSIETLCKQYIKAVNKCADQLKAKKEKLKLESDNLLKEKLQKEKQLVESEIRRIDELEMKVKEAIKQQKKDTLDDLKSQLEEAIALRKEYRNKQSEEDKGWIDEIRKQEDKKDAIKQAARDELIKYYEGLSRKAEQREEHARWIIKRHELNDKRAEFLKDEEEKLKQAYKIYLKFPTATMDSHESYVPTITPSASVTSLLTDLVNLVELANPVTDSTVEGNIDADVRAESATIKVVAERSSALDASDGILADTGSPGEVLIDFSSPQNETRDVSKKDQSQSRRNDQSQSIAKSLMYPSSDGKSILDQSITEQADETSFEASLGERFDNIGNAAKKAMYPGSVGDKSTAGSDSDQVLDAVAVDEIAVIVDEAENPDAGSSTDDPDKSIDLLSKSLIFSELSNDLRSTDIEDQDSNFGNASSTTDKLLDLRSTDGSCTKSLLYPGNAATDSATDTVYTSTRGNSNFHGEDTKELLYPGEGLQQEKPVSTVENDSLFNDGMETKSLLYPDSSSLPTVDSVVAQLKTEFEPPSTMQVLLYPSSENGDRPSSHHVKDFEPQSEMQSIIYPPSENGDRASSHHVKDFEPQSEMQSIIYPVAGADNDVNLHNTKDFERPSEMEYIIYPASGNGESKTAPHSIREFEPPSEMQSLIYPSSTSTEGVWVHKRETGEEEGSEMKNTIYPSDDNTNTGTAIKLREFEKPSSMKSIIYPDEEKRVPVTGNLSYREFEPPTRIKELIYFGNDDVDGETAVEKFNALTHEDIWKDYTPEPYIDEYDMLSMDPQSYCFPEIKNAIGKIFNNTQVDKDADLVKKLPLETVIKRSLTQPIQAQVSLVNSAIVKYFLEDLKIIDHFEAFRKFILLEDGEFGLSLCHSLFEKMKLGMKPQKFVSSMAFTNIIPEALSMSLYASTTDYSRQPTTADDHRQATTDYSRQLKFYLKWMPEEFQPSDVAALDFLELRYRVPWPCNIIITENSITKYNKVFSFLLRLKKASWNLQNVWLNLKRAGSDRNTPLSPQVRQIHLFRHEMQHFVNNLERYIVNQIIHVSWREFQDDIRHVKSLDNLHKCHHHYLDKIIFRSLLSKNANPVYNLINKMFGIIATFESRVLSQSWEIDETTGFIQHPLFGMLKDGHCTFHRATGFLFSVISNLVKRGYQDHLDDLLLQVNFNTYYDTASKK